MGTVVFMKAIFQKVFVKVKENLHTKRGKHMKVVGLEINNTEKELKNELMDLNMKANIIMVQKMVKELSLGKTDHLMLEIFKTMIYTVKEFTLGVIREFIMDNGLVIKCMEKGHLHGKMEENLKVNIKMTKKKDLVLLHGLTIDIIKENGEMVNNMVLVYITVVKKSSKREFGKTEKDKDGLKRMRKIDTV